MLCFAFSDATYLTIYSFLTIGDFQMKKKQKFSPFMEPHFINRDVGEMDEFSMDYLSAIKQLATERGLDVEDVLLYVMNHESYSGGGDIAAIIGTAGNVIGEYEYWCEIAPHLTHERRLIAAEYFNNIHTLSEFFRECICKTPDDAEALYRLIRENCVVHIAHMHTCRSRLAMLAGLKESPDKTGLCGD
jgi:hypothetical protein